MSESTVFSNELLPGGGHLSFVLKRGQLLRLTDLEGGANVSVMLFNANEKSERLNLPDSLKGQHTAKLTAGHCSGQLIPDTSIGNFSTIARS